MSSSPPEPTHAPTTGQLSCSIQRDLLELVGRAERLRSLVQLYRAVLHRWNNDASIAPRDATLRADLAMLEKQAAEIPGLVQ